MRFIYTDEAGISALEPISVVVGLIVHADTQYWMGPATLSELFRNVPARYREGFAFHAKNIMPSNKYLDWPEDSRMAFMRELMMAPRVLKIPVVVAAVKRGTGALPPPQGIGLKKVQPETADHIMAFAMCMATADAYIRNNCNNELAAVVAEDLPKIKSDLRHAVNEMRYTPMRLDALPIDQKSKSMMPDQAEGLFRVTRIIDEVHFLERKQAPFLQFADACVFGIRRFLNKQTHGEGFFRAITGENSPENELQLASPWTKFTDVYFPSAKEGGVLQPYPPGQSS